MGPHFKKDLASYGGPHVFDDEVLSRVIAASREDFNLDEQSSIAKAFTLPVFVQTRRSLVVRPPPFRILLCLPRVFMEGAGARTQEG